MLASLLRAAFCTLGSWKDTCVEMIKLASSDLAVLPFERIWKRQPWGHHWDSPPFAFVLQDAAANLPSSPGISNDVSTAVAATVAAKRAFANEFPGKKFKFHRVLSGFLLEKLFPDDISRTILRRVRKYNHELTPFVSAESLEVVRAFSLSLPASVSQQLLRTWANGWTTSYRMHETQLHKCFFGCTDQLDRQQHYLSCPTLWGVINSLLGGEPPAYFLSHLCLVNCSVLSAARLVVATLSYHTLKNSHLEFILRLSTQGNLDAIYRLLKSVGSAQLMKFSSASGIGPRDRLSQRFVM